MAVPHRRPCAEPARAERDRQAGHLRRPAVRPSEHEPSEREQAAVTGDRPLDSGGDGAHHLRARGRRRRSKLGVRMKLWPTRKELRRSGTALGFGDWQAMLAGFGGNPYPLFGYGPTYANDKLEEIPANFRGYTSGGCLGTG